MVLMNLFLLRIFSIIFCVYITGVEQALGSYYSAVNCLERLVSEMIYYVSSGTLNLTHSLTWAGISTFCLPVCI